MICNAETLEQVATSDLLIIDHSPALEKTELEVSAVEAFPGVTEDELLRFADAAFRDFDDERAVALRRTCLERGHHGTWRSDSRILPTMLRLFMGKTVLKLATLEHAPPEVSKPVILKTQNWRSGNQPIH